MPAYDNVSSTSAATATSLSWSHTCAGADRVLYVFVGGWDATGRTATCTYNSVSATEIVNVANGTEKLWGWRLVAPAAAGALTIAVTITGGVMHIWGGGISVNGAHQSDFVAPVTLTGTGTTASQTLTSDTDRLIVDGIHSGANVTHTATGTGHTERFDIAMAEGEAGAGGTTPGAASAPVGWTISASAAWAIAAIDVKPSIVAITPSYRLFPKAKMRR